MYLFLWNRLLIASTILDFRFEILDWNKRHLSSLFNLAYTNSLKSGNTFKPRNPVETIRRIVSTITNYELPSGFGSYSTWGNPKTVLPHELRIILTTYPKNSL
ncbi:hypothetical protein NIES4103_30880 [Nostoc sp. NIES-4103]|nr:hypothetical protein NIES4103_30880 [Nostoc sp. NIES-4103]